jgi:protein Mpv17
MNILFFLLSCSHPFIYFPAFYLWKGVLENLDPRVSLERCWADMWVNLKALWMLWIPAQMLNFTYVPGHLRIPFGEGYGG